MRSNLDGDSDAAVFQIDELLDDLRALDLGWWELLVASSFAKHLPAGHSAGDSYLQRAHDIATEAAHRGY